MGAQLAVICTSIPAIHKPSILPQPDIDTPCIMEVLPSFIMSETHKRSLEAHFHNTLLKQKPDAFHRTMLQCITSSPKINEIIACQKYCYRDLSKWPKLDRLSQGQINFFDSLIFQKHLEADAVSEAVYTLGVIHYRFARYGMKPHFLDLWQQQFSDILLKLRFDDDDEKRIFIEAFSIMNKYVVDVMNIAYAKCQQSAAKQEKLS